MSFKIKPFAGTSFAGDYASHYDIRAYLGFGEIVQRKFGNGETYESVKSRKLPIDFAGEIIVPLTDGRTTRLFVVEGQQSPNGWRGKSSAHRCYAICPDCGTSVPAGRTHQHKCKG